MVGREGGWQGNMKSRLAGQLAGQGGEEREGWAVGRAVWQVSRE